MAIILHLSADFPDAISKNKTPVVRDIVDSLSEKSKQLVFSLNRTVKLNKVTIHKDQEVWSIAYFGFPAGIGMRRSLSILGKKLLTELQRENIQPDLIVAHKFSVEGLLARQLSLSLNVPYVLAFMGNTDRKIFSAKPHYRELYLDTLKCSSSIIFSAPWVKKYFQPLIDDAQVDDKCLSIPFAVADDMQPKFSDKVELGRFITVCRLDLWRLKNVHRVLAALAQLKERNLIFTYDIVGPATDKTKTKILKLIKGHGLESNVHLLGKKNREQVDEMLPSYNAMLMPSYPESFGLVYLEALRAGVPILCAKNSGIDGFFEKSFPGACVKHDSINEIANAIEMLYTNHHAYVDVIRGLSGQLQQFSRQSVFKSYSDVVNEVIL